MDHIPVIPISKSLFQKWNFRRTATKMFVDWCCIMYAYFVSIYVPVLKEANVIILTWNSLHLHNIISNVTLIKLSSHWEHIFVSQVN